MLKTHKISVLIFIFAAVMLLAAHGLNAANTIYVAVTGSDTNGTGSETAPFLSIHYALTIANAGDTIFVKKGAYEITQNIEISSSDSGISVIGENAAQTILDRGYIGYNSYVFHLENVDSFTISNFTIKNAFAGVFAETTTACNFSNNIIYGNHNDGIFIGYSTDNTIESNTIYSNGGFGIYLHSSDDNRVSYNTAYTNYMGITVYFHSTGNTVTYNTAYSNSFDGIHLNLSNLNVIKYNIVHSNTNDGLFLDNSDTNLISNNTLYLNSDGMELNASYANKIFSDTLYQNSMFGINLTEAFYTEIDSNTSTSDKYGILNSSDGDTILSSTVFGNNNYSNGNRVEYYEALPGSTISGSTMGGLILKDSENSTLSKITITGGPVILINSDNTAVSEVTLSNSSFLAISGSDNCKISNSKLDNMYTGIKLINSDSAHITRTLILSNKYGIYFEGSIADTVENITQANADYGLFYGSGSAAGGYVKNSIFFNNSYGLYNSDTVNAPIVLYSDFNNSINLYNATIDTSTISANPVFANTTNADSSDYYALSSLSPCRDSGDPGTLADTTGWKGRIDMGYAEYINNAPAAVIGSDSTAAAGDIVVLTGTGSYDSDSDALSYKWTQTGGDSITISDSTNDTATFTAPLAGNYKFNLTVYDGELYDTAEININITISIHGAVVHNSDTISGIAVSLSGPSSGSRTSDSSGFEFCGLTKGDYTLTIDTSGGKISHPDSFLWTNLNTSIETAVFNINTLPGISINSISDKTLLGQCNIDASSTTDTDGDALTYVWTQIAGETVTLNSANTLQPYFSAVKYDTYIFGMTASDGWDTSYDSVTVRFLNSTPNAVTQADTYYCSIGDTVSLSAENSSDPNGDTLYFLWRQVGGDTVTLLNPYDSVLNAVPETVGVYMFEVSVSDTQYSDTALIHLITRAKLGGTVYYKNIGVTGTTVTLTGDSESMFITQSDGKFLFPDCAAGTYTITADKSGFEVFPKSVYFADLKTDSTSITFDITTVPLADAGQDITSNLYDTAVLDGSLSNDIDGDTISYKWTLPNSDTAISISDTSLSKLYVRASEIDTYTFTLRVMDSYGAFSVDTVLLYARDLTPPTNGSVIINNGDVYTNSLSFTVALSAESQPVEVELAQSPSFSGDILHSTFTDTKTWFWLEQTEGIKTIYARFYDTYTNQSATHTDTIIYDITPPEVFVDTGMNDTTVKGTISINLNYKSSDIDTVLLYLTSAAGENIIFDTIVSVAGDTGIVSINTPLYDDGYYSVFAHSYDFAGNDSTSNSIMIYIDNTAPHCTISSPADNSIISGNYVPISVSYRAADIKQIIFSYSTASETVVFDTITKQGDTTVYLDVSALPDSTEITVSVQASDTNGNIDTSPGTAALVVNSKQSLYGGQKFLFSFGEDYMYSQGNGIEIYFPKNSIKSSQFITLSWFKQTPPATAAPELADTTHAYYILSLEASDITEFSSYVSISMPVIDKTTDVSAYRMHHYDEKTAKWEKLSNSWPEQEKNSVICKTQLTGYFSPFISNNTADASYSKEYVFNYPNPVKSSGTTFRIYALENGAAEIIILNFNGELIKTISSDLFANAWKDIKWDAAEADFGLYFYVVKITYSSGIQKIFRNKMFVLK